MDSENSAEVAMSQDVNHVELHSEVRLSVMFFTTSKANEISGYFLSICQAFTPLEVNDKYTFKSTL